MSFLPSFRERHGSGAEVSWLAGSEPAPGFAPEEKWHEAHCGNCSDTVSLPPAARFHTGVRHCHTVLGAGYMLALAAHCPGVAEDAAVLAGAAIAQVADTCRLGSVAEVVIGTAPAFGTAVPVTGTTGGNGAVERTAGTWAGTGAAEIAGAAAGNVKGPSKPCSGARSWQGC